MALRQFDFTFKAMACRNQLSIYAKNKKKAQAVAQQAIAAVNQLERRYSRYLPDSLLSAINRSAGDPNGVLVDQETAALLNYAQTCYQQSDGLFDVSSGVLRTIWNFKQQKLPTQTQITETLQRIGWDKIIWQEPRIVLPVAGMELDFGGVVKEYAADTCATLCRSLGIKHGMINMGGDIHAIGSHPDGKPWQIGIQDPDDPSRVATKVNLKYGGLASSGDYQRFMMIDGKRYGHILNPITGWPVQGLRAVSVVAPQCLIAGSTSTIAMLKGEAGKLWLAQLGLPYVAFDDEGQIHNGHKIDERNTKLLDSVCSVNRPAITS